MDSGYINSHDTNPNLVAGFQSYSCYYISEKDEILAKTGKKDEVTTVTSTYTEMDNKE